MANYPAEDLHLGGPGQGIYLQGRVFKFSGFGPVEIKITVISEMHAWFGTYLMDWNQISHVETGNGNSDEKRRSGQLVVCVVNSSKEGGLRYCNIMMREG